MNDRFSHFVLTRFNVRVEVDSLPPSDEWLADRLELFSQFCIPSLVGQTEKRFRWLVFFDGESPRWFRDAIDLLCLNAFEPVYLNGMFTAESVGNEVRNRARTRHVITTRMDNDDAVARDFIELIQNGFCGQDFEFLNIVSGAQYCVATGNVYARPYPNNPFISLVELVDGHVATVFVDEHYLLSRHGHVLNLPSSHPMWLQIVHGQNLANEIVGLRTPGPAVLDHFPICQSNHDGIVELSVDRLRGGARIALRLVQKPARFVALGRIAFAHIGGLLTRRMRRVRRSD